MESYREFLDRIHRQDVERGQGIHKEGDCAICNEVVYHQKVRLSEREKQ